MSTVDGSRSSKVEAARKGWISRLIDLSQQNRLLYFRQLKVGTLDLTGASHEVLADLFNGSTVPIHKLLPTADKTQLAAQAIEIGRKAKENAEERGLETLFVACGMATWKGEEGKRNPESAAALLPVVVENHRSQPALRRTGEAMLNPVLLHVLATDFGCDIDGPSLMKTAVQGKDDEAFDLSALVSQLRLAAAEVPQFDVSHRLVLGNFSFQKMAMVRDLKECGETLSESDVIAALAGDAMACEKILGNESEPDPREFDETPPSQEFLALDSDSSQQKAIRMALRGQNIVIQGPPGTGKSQVIANLIGAAAAEGKRILFVAEKRAALEVVLARLSKCGLGHLTLDLHGADRSRKKIALQIRQSLDRIAATKMGGTSEVPPTFESCRTSLNRHDQKLHESYSPCNLTAFELQERLLRNGGDEELRTRLRGVSLLTLHREQMEEIKGLLLEGRSVEELMLRIRKSPWVEADLADGHAAQAAVDTMARLMDSIWPRVLSFARLDIWSERRTKPSTLNELMLSFQLAKEVNAFLLHYDHGIFENDMVQLVKALEPAARGPFRRLFASLFSARYRRAKKLFGSACREPVVLSKMLGDAKQAASWKERWVNVGFRGNPVVTEVEAEELDQALQGLQAVFDFARIFKRANPAAARVEQVDKWLKSLDSDENAAMQIPIVRRIEARLQQLGITPLLEEIRCLKLPAKSWGAAFERVWLWSWLEYVRAEDQKLVSFNGRAHDETVKEFCATDRSRLSLAAAAVARRHAQLAATALDQKRDESRLVRHEAEKKIRHISFRKLMEGGGSMVTALFPCIMCSPLSVSELLPAEKDMFDLVVFDEASQVMPEAAVAALMRGKYAIVAGDEHQLPPTQFFADDSGADDAEIESPSGGFESLLKMMKAFVPSPMLQWHYRSKDERLIAFSNHHIYSDRLVTFPGPGGSDAPIQHVLVESNDSRGPEESDSAEVRRVVELVIELAKQEIKKPRDEQRSVGVIAMGVIHARRIEGAVDRAISENGELEPFFDSQAAERFFVKNLERVQGDERDVIILSLGVAPDAAGRVNLTGFGPLNNREHGHRRLNVAVSRARQRMILVSSFSHHAIGLSNNSSRGMQLLRHYLEYAASGGTVVGRQAATNVRLNSFEADIADALGARGIQTIPQWGASQYRIDLVALHQHRPGRMVLAIECDGASYHSAPTARDRDRLRQQHLEALGWKFHRIWSTDWFTRRQEEIERAVRAFGVASDFADREDSIGPAP